MSTFSFTNTQTFTVTHARHIASKIATDLKRMQRFYGYPSDSSIAQFETEATELLKLGYLDNVTYGFKRGENWIVPTLKYTAKDLVTAGLDDDPGRVPIGANIEGAGFYSYLCRNQAWWDLSQSDRNKIEEGLPFKRTGASYPGLSGYFSQDKSYNSGGKGVDRFTLKNY